MALANKMAMNPWRILRYLIKIGGEVTQVVDGIICLAIQKTGLPSDNNRRLPARKMLPGLKGFARNEDVAGFKGGSKKSSRNEDVAGFKGGSKKFNHNKDVAVFEGGLPTRRCCWVQRGLPATNMSPGLKGVRPQ